MALLHYQERILQQRKQVESWKTAYKLPTSADRFVIEFRNWFDKYCQGQLPWGETSMPLKDEPPVSNREVLLDRYRQHTINCRSCRLALKTLQRLQFVLKGYFAVTVAGVALMPDVLRVNLGLPLTVLALMALGIYAWLKYSVEPRFYFVDYVHADK